MADVVEQPETDYERVQNSEEFQQLRRAPELEAEGESELGTCRWTHRTDPLLVAAVRALDVKDAKFGSAMA